MESRLGPLLEPLNRISWTECGRIRFRHGHVCGRRRRWRACPPFSATERATFSNATLGAPSGCTFGDSIEPLHLVFVFRGKKYQGSRECATHLAAESVSFKVREFGAMKIEDMPALDEMKLRELRTANFLGK